MSRVDLIYRKLLLTKFFTRGWGKPENLKRIFNLRRQLSNRRTAAALTSHETHGSRVEITSEEVRSDHVILEGHFLTPLVKYLPGLLPKETEKAHFQAVLPLSFRDGSGGSPSRQPIVVQYAGTGDHFFWRRRHLMALPMIRERNIGSVILEAPFYGLRKPKDQFRSSLREVSDLFLMGACLILESAVLYDWCERGMGFKGPLVSHGISMGGHMASLGATVWPKPIALVPCLSWSSGSITFTGRGALTGAIPWGLLKEQYAQSQAFRNEIATIIRCEDNAFRAGREFTQNLIRNESGSDSSTLSTDTYCEVPRLADNDADPESTSFLGNADRDRRPATNKVFSEESVQHSEALQFMRGIMDEFTHLKNYDVPVDPELIIIVAAEHDAYMPRDGITALPEIWPGSKLRFIESRGHVASYLFKQSVFRQAIYDAVDLYCQKYPNNSHLTDN